MATPLHTYQSKSIVKKLLLAVLFLLVVAFLIYILLKTKNTIAPIEQQTVSDPIETFTVGSLQFSYPQALVIAKNENSVTLSHSITYKHQDFCDFKGDAPELNDVVDFGATFKTTGLDFKNAVRLNEGDDFVKEHFTGSDNIILSEGWIDAYQVGIFNGYVISMGIEGCGRSTYYFPISESETLVVHGPYINDLRYSSEEYLKLPGFITHEQEEKMFRDILLSAKPNHTITSSEFSWKIVVIDGVNIPIPESWQIIPPQAIDYSECRTITCESLLGMRGSLSYKLYDPKITTADKMYDEKAIYITSTDCKVSAVPCPVPINNQESYPNAKEYKIKDSLYIQTYGSVLDTLNIYNEIVDKLKNS